MLQKITIAILFTGLFACKTPVPNLTGAWESPEWGSLYLKQSGNLITGTYTHDQGQLSGTFQNGEIRFRWWEKVAVGQGYESASTSERGDGYFRVATDQKSLSGEWKYDGSTSWKGKWTATRK